MKVSLILVLVAAAVRANNVTDPVADQLLIYRDQHKHPELLTTSGGAPVSYAQATNTLNTNLINNEYFMDLFSNVVRERIPERVVHAKGTGAFGFFEVTNDYSHICKADFLSKVGKKTPCVVRFASSGGSKGSSDLVLDARGFSIKLYTCEGNFDMAGFNTPISSFKEPLKAHNIIHTPRANAATGCLDPNMLWEKSTLIPESLFMLLYTYSGRGRPAAYQNMPGFPIHTYQVENNNSETHFIRMHFYPEAGIKNLGNEEANKLGIGESDYLTKKLYRAIENGEYPTWIVYWQILTTEDMEKEGPSKIVDVTNIIPEDRYPLHKIGKLVLNRNPKNHHAEIEQLAFCPCNTLPSIRGTGKLYEARRLVYRDAQNYRLGGNVRNIPVNCPFRVKTATYNRDGVAPVNNDDGPNYFPNSFNGPQPHNEKEVDLIDVPECEPDNFEEAGHFYANVLTCEERATLIKNILSGLKSVLPLIKERAIKLFHKIHDHLGTQVARGLNSTIV